jgi:hypothetical protein
MADTRYLTTVVEAHVRDVLSARYGVAFEKRKLPLTTGGRHEFDAVSPDGEFVASIKSASGTTAGGRIPSGKIKDSIAEIYFLSLVEAPTRQLILTTPGFYEILMRSLRGKVAPGVDIVLEQLPPEVQAEVDRVQATASREVFPVLDADEVP